MNVTAKVKQSIYLPDSVTEINGKHVERMTSFDIPTFVTSIDKNCFSECSLLKSLSFPKSLKDIPMSLLNDCKTLTNIP